MQDDSTIKPPKTKTKKKKVQGKLNPQVIIEELTRKKIKPLYEIAKMAGSSAKTDKELATAVTQKVANSSEIQLALEEHKRMQKVRALARVQKAERLIDYEVMSADQKVLGGFLIANEKLLHESVKVSSEDEREKSRSNTSSTDNMTTSEIEAILETKKKNIARLKETIEGVIVK